MKLFRYSTSHCHFCKEPLKSYVDDQIDQCINDDCEAFFNVYKNIFMLNVNYDNYIISFDIGDYYIEVHQPKDESNSGKIELEHKIESEKFIINSIVDINYVNYNQVIPSIKKLAIFM